MFSSLVFGHLLFYISYGKKQTLHANKPKPVFETFYSVRRLFRPTSISAALAAIILWTGEMSKRSDDSMLFPQKLMDILADPLNQGTISWLPDGKSFVIRDRTLFAEIVMPRYFPRKAKFSSFTRKLNRWCVFKNYHTSVVLRNK